VNVHEDLFTEFKVLGVRHKMSFQKLADRTLYLYITDEEFRAKIHNQLNLRLDK
jgi:hypothetical protein